MVHAADSCSQIWGRIGGARRGQVMALDFRVAGKETRKVTI